MRERTVSQQLRLRADRAARTTGRHVQRILGGQARTRVIVVLACVLALSSADAATVGAAATQLRRALHIGNTDIGLLVTVTSLVAAVASIPFGMAADRMRRTRTLGLVIVVWGLAMLWSATSSSFSRLLLARLLLGLVTAAAGPIVASLIGDYFDASERGRIYSYILTGELAGAGIGFAVTGDIAALSWRAAFVILALPAFVLAWYVIRLPEPVRGGHRPLQSDSAPASWAGSATEDGREVADSDGHRPTEAQRLAAERGIVADETRVVGEEGHSLGIIAAARVVLGIRTNIILIVAGACGYFYLSGVETFGAEFVHEQYRINQALANFLLLIVGLGAMVGVVFSGRISDRLLARGFLNSRIVVAAVAAAVAALMFIPALTTRSAVAALPYLMLAACMLSAQNPPIDAARLDIVPPNLWGRAEGVRTALRTLAQSIAPLTFGALADHVFGGGRHGLQLAFGTMLITMFASGVILFRATKTYPRDVATAAASAAASGLAGDDPTRRHRSRRAGPDPEGPGQPGGQPGGAPFVPPYPPPPVPPTPSGGNQTGPNGVDGPEWPRPAQGWPDRGDAGG
jgi:predicted MFS family arabinose efflux permease